MRTLHHILGLHGHVVAQVVETKLGVGTEGDVAVIGCAAFGRVGLRLVDTSHAHAMELIERTHPLRVTFGEVVVHGHHVHTLACQCVEEHRQRSHQRLTFTGCHLGNFTQMQYDTANELHIVVNHVPGDFVTAGNPVVEIHGLVAANLQEILALRGEVAVKVVGSHLNLLVLGKAAGGVLHNGKHLGQHLVEFVFEAVENFLVDLVHLLPQGLTLLIVDGLDFSLDFGYLVALRLHIVGNVLANGGTAGTQFVVGHLLNRRIDFLNLVQHGAHLLHIALTLVAEY